MRHLIPESVEFPFYEFFAQAENLAVNLDLPVWGIGKFRRTRHTVLEYREASRMIQMFR